MAHPENTKYLSVHVPSQLPEFTREDHATFVSFMEAYFEFLDQQGGAAEIINALSDYANIDKTVDSFVDHFKEQFLHDIPNKVVTDKAFLVKNIREFYRSRGSEKSFQFLFRTMWQEEITIDHPKDNILKPSDGNWVVDRIIKVEESAGLSKFAGKEIQGSTSNATAVVENIVTIRENKFDVTEMLISNIAGTFEIGETITATDNDGSTLSTVLGGMIGSVTVDIPGSNYSVGQVLDVTGGGGQFGEGRLLLEDTSGILLKEDATHIVAEEDFGVNMKVSVKELQGGTIDSVKIVDGGTGYSKGDYLTLNNTNALQNDGNSGALRVLEVAGRLNGIAIANKGENYLNPPLVSFTGGGGTGAQAITSLEGGPISTCSISYGGTGYDVNDIITFHGGGGSSGLGKVSSVNTKEQFILEDGTYLFLEDGDLLATEASEGITGITITNGGSDYLTEPETTITKGTTNILLEDGEDILLEMDQVEPYVSGTTSKLNKEHSGGTGAILVPNGWGRVSSIIFDPPTFDGKNYSTVPTITLTRVGNSGSGATATATVAGTTGDGKILEVEIENPGKDYIAIPTVDATGKGNGNASITLGSTTIGGIRLLSIGRPGFNVTKPPIIDASGFGDGNAKISSTAAAQFVVGDGHWEGTKSFISHDQYIQDSNFYQIYSYVINHGGQTADFWRDTVKRVLHPAGFNLFSQIDVLSEMGLPLTTMSIRAPREFHDLPGEPEWDKGEDLSLILVLTFNLANTFDASAILDFSTGEPNTTVIFVPGAGTFQIGETVTFSNGTTVTIVDITEDGIVIDDSTLSGPLPDEGTSVTGNTSGASGTVAEFKKPSSLITSKRRLGPTWRTIDYQKFFTTAGFSNKERFPMEIENDGTTRMELEGQYRNPYELNLELVSQSATPQWPTTHTYRLVEKILLEDGSYILSEVHQPGDLILFEDGDISVMEDQRDASGSYTINDFKDVVLAKIIDDTGRTRNNTRKRITSESYITFHPYSP